MWPLRENVSLLTYVVPDKATITVSQAFFFLNASSNLSTFLIAFVLSGEKPPWGAELRFELGPA